MNTPHTEKLYLQDPYVTEFQARVISAAPGGAGLAVVLDRTCFYPESGGQTADHGLLGGRKVIDVQEGDGDTVVHVVSGDGEIARDVGGRIDWDRRFDHMQQHTGQHVLSRAFIETGGLHTVSFHMGDDTCTIDLDGKSWGDDSAMRAEDLANRVIEENRSVRVRTVPLADLDESELRRKVPEGVTDVRLVEVEGFDVIPCCGTHVASTGQLALVKVLKQEKAKGNFRVHFKVGRRAIADYREKHDIVQSLANRLTTSGPDVATKVEKLVTESQSGRKTIRRLEQKLAVVEKDLLLAAAQRTGGYKIVVQYIEDADADYLRALSGELRAAGGVIALLAAGDGALICTASEGIDIDLAGPALDLVRAMGGSGGGKGAFAQGRLPREVDLKKLLKSVEEDVRHRI